MTDILLIGATGMVGSAFITQCAAPVTVLARRQPDIDVWPASVTAVVAPGGDWVDHVAQIAPAVLINCLGTTIAQAGSQAAFRAVDHDLALSIAAAARAAGARHMISISSVGASADSSNFYLRTKGQVEQTLAAMAFDRLDIIQPGLLIGDRKGPRRTGESIGMALSPLTDALMLGGLRRYRSVKASTVARAITALVRNGGTGQHVHQHDAIVALGD